MVYCNMGFKPPIFPSQLIFNKLFFLSPATGGPTELNAYNDPEGSVKGIKETTSGMRKIYWKMPKNPVKCFFIFFAILVN